MIDEKLIDDRKCLQVVTTLNQYYKDKNDIANIEYPSSIKYCSKEYFLYMFYSCLLDYGMRSKIYHQNLARTYELHSEIFNPWFVSDCREEELKEIIVNFIHPRYPNVALKKWIELSHELIQYDDILETLKTITSFQELNYFVKNMKGYGQKTGGLLVRIITDSAICHFKEEVESIPIDRHDIEISYLVGIIKHKKLLSKEIEWLSNAYVKAGKKLSINPSDIDKYLWEIGNTFCNRKKCEGCPLSKFCIKKVKN